MDSGNEKEAAHQQDTEEHAMMAWDTLDDPSIDNMEEEKPKADETKLEDKEDDKFNFCGLMLKLHEIMLGGQIYWKI